MRLLQFLSLLFFLFLAASCSKKGTVSYYKSSSDKPAPTSPSKPTTTPPASSGTVSKKRREMADYARKYIGTPYKYAGTNPKTGFDCSGFTSFVYKGFGFPITPASRGQAVLGNEVSLSKVQPGDLVFFAENGRDVSHVAMVSRRDGKNVYCIHSTTSRGVIEENITTSKYWQQRLLYARDVIGK
ncbi:MAG: C40 family peptidase [Saprospiraceae bacterium]|nr:C40 family peptidase [Saprospiraceae bacterium]MCC6411762.1 C40 family peptidase [Saprospiraceae bacterium]